MARNFISLEFGKILYDTILAGVQTFKREGRRVPIVAQWVKNLHSICEDAHSITGLTQWVQDLALLQAAA